MSDEIKEEVKEEQKEEVDKEQPGSEPDWYKQLLRPEQEATAPEPEPPKPEAPAPEPAPKSEPGDLDKLKQQLKDETKQELFSELDQMRQRSDASRYAEGRAAVRSTAIQAAANVINELKDVPEYQDSARKVVIDASLENVIENAVHSAALGDSRLLETIGKPGFAKQFTGLMSLTNQLPDGIHSARSDVMSEADSSESFLSSDEEAELKEYGYNPSKYTGDVSVEIGKSVSKWGV